MTAVVEREGERVRVALMALTEQGGAPVRLGGKPVAWHQLQAILALGCERVVCLAEAPGPSLSALQQESEARGARFSAVAHHRAVSGLVSAADTLFVFAPGVLVDRDWLAQGIGARAGVAVLPADRAVERGFERIDRQHAWAGVLATRGDGVEALSALPPDADPIAGLLRVALQRGGRCVEVPEQWLDEGRWALLGDSAAAQRLEAGWQTRNVPAPAAERPVEFLAHRAARALLARAADLPALAPALAIGGLVLAAGGAVVGYLGSTTAGLGLIAFGALAAHTGERLGLFARAGSGVTARGRGIEIRDAVLDLSLIAIATSPREFSGWLVPFVAAVLVVAVRFAREDTAPRFLRPLGDRGLVFFILAFTAAVGAFVPAAALLGLLGLAARLFRPPVTRLTQA